MTDEQYKRCLSCLNRNEYVFDKKNICNLRGKNLDFEGDCQDYYYDKTAYIPEFPNKFKLYKLHKKKALKFDCAFFAKITTGILMLSALIVSVFFDDNEFIMSVLQKVVIAFMIFSYFCLIRNYSIKIPIEGDYLGDLILEKDNITILNQLIPLNEIKNIRLLGADIEGNMIDHQNFFSPSLSNGTRNKLIVTLKNGKVIKHNFFRESFDEMLRIKELLSNYYLQGVITRSDMKDMFGKKYVKKFSEAHSLPCI